MKILLNLIIALSLLAVLSCQKDQATNQSEDFSLNSILNDSNWVEVTDTLSIDIKCLSIENYQTKYFINDTIGYNNLKNKKSQIREDCTNYNYPGVDFKKYTLIGYPIIQRPSNITKRVFKNSRDKQLLYKLDIETKTVNKIGIYYHNFILIPKISNDFSLIVDTTVIKKH